MAHMTTYGAQMDRKRTGSGPEVGQKWTRSGPEIYKASKVPTDRNNAT